MGRVLAVVYGIVAYLVFLAAFLYAIGFVGNVAVPKSIDSGQASAFLTSLFVDALLLTAFAVQHSVMARPEFKRRWTRIVPPQIERSTYVLLSSLVLVLLFAKWHPMPAVIWDAGNGGVAALLTALFWFGWLMVLTSTYMINHFDLFGLRQVYLNFQRRPYTPLKFTHRGLYRIVRHPIMLGFIVAFWSTPRMTLGHLVFAVATTGYILLALQLEERDLLTYHGALYARYRDSTSMLLPIPKRARPTGDTGVGA